MYPRWAQVSGFSNGCYKRYETKDEAFTAFGACMKGGTYEQKVEHEVVKRNEGEKINYVQIHCHRYLVCCHCWSLLRGTPIDSLVYVYFF